MTFEIQVNTFPCDIPIFHNYVESVQWKNGDKNVRPWDPPATRTETMKGRVNELETQLEDEDFRFLLG